MQLWSKSAEFQDDKKTLRLHSTLTQSDTRHDHLKTVSTRGIVTEVETSTPKICQKLLPPMNLVGEKYGKCLFSAQETVLSCQSSASWSPEGVMNPFWQMAILAIISWPSQTSSAGTSHGQHILSHLTPLTRSEIQRFEEQSQRFRLWSMGDMYNIYIYMIIRPWVPKRFYVFWGVGHPNDSSSA